MSRQGMIHCIIPPHLLEQLLESKDKRKREIALNTSLATTRLRSERQVMGQMATLAVTAAGEKRRTIYDAKNEETTSGELVRGEDDQPSTDEAVNEAFDGLGATYDFYSKVLDRNSIDDRGMRLDAYKDQAEPSGRIIDFIVAASAQCIPAKERTPNAIRPFNRSNGDRI